MATKKVAKKTEAVKQETLVKESKTSVLGKINPLLSTIFYIIWIFVGIFFLIFIYGNIRQGLLENLFRPTSRDTGQAAQTPTETTLPGVGIVNIECVQSSVSSEAIQKIVTDGNTSNLTDEEKTKFEPCIIEAQQATPEASP